MVTLTLSDLEDLTKFEEFIKYSIEELLDRATPYLIEKLTTHSEFYDSDIRTYMGNREDHMNDSYTDISFVEENGQYYCNLDNPTSAFYYLFVGHQHPFIYAPAGEKMSFYWTNGHRWLKTETVRSNTHPDTNHHYRFRGFLEESIQSSIDIADTELTREFRSDMRRYGITELNEISEMYFNDFESNLDRLETALYNFKYNQFLYNEDWNEFEDRYKEAYHSVIEKYESEISGATGYIKIQERRIEVLKHKKKWGVREAREKIGSAEKRIKGYEEEKKAFYHKAYKIKRLIR